MRPLTIALALLLAACTREAPAPEGNPQAVIDKADQDVAAATAEAAAPPPAGSAE